MNEKDNTLFSKEAKLNELEVKVSELLSEKSNLTNERAISVEERGKQIKKEDELKAKVEDLTAKLKTKEVETVRALVEIVELEKRVAESQVSDEVNGSSGLKGFNETDKLRAIEDIVKLQGKSMAVMTESFKTVVQEVREMRNDLVKKKDGKAYTTVTQAPPQTWNKISYAEAFIKRNSASIRSRNVIINDGEDAELINKIKKDATYNSLAIDTVRTQANRINVTLSD